MVKNLAFFPVIADNLHGMTTALQLEKGKDTYDTILHILVDMQINIDHCVSLSGTNKEEFSRLVQKRIAEIKDKKKTIQTTGPGLILPVSYGDREDPTK